MASTRSHGSAPAASGANSQPVASAPASASAPAGKPPATAAKGSGDVFKRTLTVRDMVVYGLISMVPISPFPIYASVFDVSHGMPTLTYLITLGAMVLTVLSFCMMIPRFQSSGSIFTYVSEGMGRPLGFIAGWLMLLQYLVYPVLVYLMGGLALNQYFPAVPIWGWCLMFLAFVTFVALRGMQTTMVVNRIALAGELIVLALFLGFGIYYVIAHPDTGGFTAQAVVNPQKLDLGATMSAVALAAQSFVGFGCVATLTEEAKDGKRGPGKAMMIMVLMLGFFFALQCYVATCIDPSGGVFAHDEDNGFYLVAQLAAGPWLAVVCALAVALSQGIFTGLVNVVSVSRIIFTMGKSNALPKVFARFDHRTDTPYVAVIFVCALSLVLLPIMIALGLDKVADISNFGALSTYFLLNLCVIWYFRVRLKERGRILRTLVCPAAGAVIIVVVLTHAALVAVAIGCAWIAIGVIYYLVATKVLHRKMSL